MGPGDGNYDGNRYHKKPILRFGDFTDRFNANRMNRSQYAPARLRLPLGVYTLGIYDEVNIDIYFD